MINDIKDPSFLKTLNKKERKKLAEEIRSFLIEEISKSGGHLASNLGVVELTIALHYVFNTSDDALIFDVGHQAYTHKILTGRINEFNTLRKLDGMSGYPSYKESIYDKWESGHAGSSISAMMGYLYAKSLNDELGDVITIIGDASITNGMAFEALNLLGSDKNHKGIIILNDNKMAISRNVGSTSRVLNRLRGSKGYRRIKRFWQIVLPKFVIRFFSRVKRGLKGFFQRQNIFEDLGYMYIGPIDGHNIDGIIYALKQAKNSKKSVVVHVLTEKGKGYEKAENDTTGIYHGVSAFDINSGEIIQKNDEVSWSEIISEIIIDLEKVEEIFVIMSAMTIGSKFEKFANFFPKLFLDVGISEEHAASMASAMAINNVKVFLPFYSTFSQRAFDQILNDIARPNKHVVIGIDRAGIIGEDGSTHQGLFDLSMFNLMPNIIITMPYDEKEAYDLLYYGFFEQNSPFVVRYPRGTLMKMKEIYKYEKLKLVWNYIKKGNQISIITYGKSIDLMKNVIENENIDANIINARIIKPIDYKMIDELCKNEKMPILVYEENTSIGGIFSEISKYMIQKKYTNNIHNMSITDRIVEHGSYSDILAKLEMDEKAVLEKIKVILNETR